MKHAIKKFAFAASAVILLQTAACTPTQAVRGNIVEDYRLTELKPGIDTQFDVLNKLGSPTTKAPFDDNIWYYIGQETEKRGILDPKVKEEKIVALFFDPQGLLLEAKDIDNQRIDLPYVRQKTPTSGNDLTAMEQFIGNLGRFNKDNSGNTNSATTGTGGN